MDLDYSRLDGTSLWTVTHESRTIVLDEDQHHRMLTELDNLTACWPQPAPAQIWEALSRALDRDPRES